MGDTMRQVTAQMSTPKNGDDRRCAWAASQSPPEEEVVRHTLERLEAALRARTAAGLG